MNLTHHFLVSMPIVTDDYFSRSVIYLVEHNADGAWGVVVNKPVGLNLGDIFDQLDITCDDKERSKTAVLRGGPVDEQQGIVLHRTGANFESTKNYQGGVSMSSSEIVDNAWLTDPASANQLFDNAPVTLRAVVADSIGVNLNLLGTQAGHA